MRARARATTRDVRTYMLHFSDARAHCRGIKLVCVCVGEIFFFLHRFVARFVRIIIARRLAYSRGDCTRMLIVHAGGKKMIIARIGWVCVCVVGFLWVVNCAKENRWVFCIWNWLGGGIVVDFEF